MSDIQQELNQLQDRIAELEEQVVSESEEESQDNGISPTMSRRAALYTLLGIGGLGVATQPAAAQSKGAACEWLGDQNASQYSLYDLAMLDLYDSGEDPSENGRFTNNAGDVKVQTGGSVKNLSDIGSGSGSSVLSDSNNDTADGGDIYQLPQIEDAIDFQSGGELLNAESVDATTLTGGLVETDTLNGADISSSANAERALETDGNGNLNPVTAVTDGDGIKREIWVIANGASDPAGADADDIILEEEA